MPNFIDLTDQRFGMLQALSRAPKQGSVTKWICLCDCGNRCEVRQQHLSIGKTRSCGCLLQKHRQDFVKDNLVHGASVRGSVSLTYTCWISMINRCSKPGYSNWRLYGGRGIKVCPQWLDYNQFIADMGERPSKQHSIDRINSDGDYEPGNCRWSTPKEQSRNKRNNKFLTFQGKTQCISAWAEELGIDKSTIGTRLRRGWDIESALMGKKRKA